MGGRLDSVTLGFLAHSLFLARHAFDVLDRLDGWGSVSDVGYELSNLACKKGQKENVLSAVLCCAV